MEIKIRKGKTWVTLDGAYTKMLRMVLGISWKDKVGNDVLYGKLPKLSDKIWSRRLKLAEHCLRHPELLVLANYQVTGKPKAEQRETKSGRPRQSYLLTLLWDAGMNTKEKLQALMRDRIWRKISKVDRTLLRLSSSCSN